MGGHVAGVVDAMDRRSAVTALAGRGHFVTHLAEQGQDRASDRDNRSAFELPRLPSLGGGRVTSKDVLAMTTQLSTAVRAGLPLLHCLELLAKQQHKPAAKAMLEHLVKSVSSGASLSEAMSECSRVFSPLYISMIRVGETGGILEQTSTQLAAMLNREVVSAVVIVTGILPRILATVDVGVAAMPLPTRILMGLSDFTRTLFTHVAGWVVLATTFASLLALSQWARTAGKLSWDRFKLRIPVLGSVLRTIAVGRFARTLGALTQGGVTILEALAVVRDTLGNEALGQEIDEVAEKVKRGDSLAAPLEESGYFPPLLVQIVAVGEQTGKLDELLLNAAETFDNDADAAINRFMSVFPAVLILVLALIIGFIIAAALLPIVAMSLGAGTI